LCASFNAAPQTKLWQRQVVASMLCIFEEESWRLALQRLTATANSVAKTLKQINQTCHPGMSAEKI
jgi:hypothetical protein